MCAVVLLRLIQREMVKQMVENESIVANMTITRELSWKVFE